MTIKEIEQLSGMTRANIRFYEAEGLLNPDRKPNGYRDYSENDLEELKRIRLLRTLHISLEEIKSLHAGESELTDALERHLKDLELDKADIEQSQKICRAMRSDGVSYGTLDAQYYLDAFERGIPALTEDAVPKVRAPWRRYFARALDFAVYSMLWSVFLSLVAGVNLFLRNGVVNILDIIVAYLMMLFMEPLFLSLFGTTPGKWILGLRVTSPDDSRLTYSQALERTVYLLVYGMGCCVLPLVNIWRLIKSCKDCSNGETLRWEYDSVVTLKDTKRKRIAAFFGAHALIFCVLFVTLTAVNIPRHIGDISVAEFCENYNHFNDFNGRLSGKILDENGKWIDNPKNQYYTTIDIFTGGIDSIGNYPEFVFTEENGVMTGMSFTATFNDPESNEWGHIWSYRYYNNYFDEKVISLFSFVRAQSVFGIFSKDVSEIEEYMSDHPFWSFRYTVYGVNINYHVEYHGYYEEDGRLIAMDDDPGKSYTISFSMEKA